MIMVAKTHQRWKAMLEEELREVDRKLRIVYSIEESICSIVGEKVNLEEIVGV